MGGDTYLLSRVWMLILGRAGALMLDKKTYENFPSVLVKSRQMGNEQINDSLKSCSEIRCL